ncbi:MAG: hypothetical protein ACRD2P_13480 [Terriglobia bacterium]
MTTDSDHGFEVYLNLAGRMKLTGIDQLWVADITYIRLNAEFVYLAYEPDNDRTIADASEPRGSVQPRPAPGTWSGAGYPR